jgi:uncharacterized protein (UPF0335 family)
MTDAIQLRSFVERIERLEEEIKTINTDKRDVYAEAKGLRLDIPALKAAIAYRRKDADKADQHRALFDLYLDILSERSGRPETPEPNKRISAVPLANAGPSGKNAPTRARASQNEIKTASTNSQDSIAKSPEIESRDTPTDAPDKSEIPDFLRRASSGGFADDSAIDLST